MRRASVKDKPSKHYGNECMRKNLNWFRQHNAEWQSIYGIIGLAYFPIDVNHLCVQNGSPPNGGVLQPQVVRQGLCRASPGPSGSQALCLIVATIDPHTPFAHRGPTQFTFMPSFRDRYGIKYL